MSNPQHTETGGSFPGGSPQVPPERQDPDETTVVSPGDSPNLIDPKPPAGTGDLPPTPRTPERRAYLKDVPSVEWWEPAMVLVTTFLFLALLAPRIIGYLSPVTGDEPFYLMTTISMIEDRDVNECNNFRAREEARFYPESVVTAKVLPAGWLGWNAAPYPLPPHPAKIIPASRRCFGSDINPNYYLPDSRYPLPADGTQSELYSKHGIGLPMLLVLPYALGDRPFVVFFLNLLAALVAVNIYLLARQGARGTFPALLTWVAFAFTVPLLSYSYLIFPELPAALLVIYAFRRIWLGRNNALQLVLVGLCMAFLPWLHYRFAPVTFGLALFFVFRLAQRKDLAPRKRAYQAVVVFLPVLVSLAGEMLYFYFLYGQPYPNAADHAGISDFAGTMRGVAGSYFDGQWGLFFVTPVYLLAFVGLAMMLLNRERRGDVLWLAVVGFPYFAVVANYAQWWGEWGPPARYLTAVLPLLALPFAYSLSRLTGIRAGLYGAMYAILAIPGFLAAWAFLINPQWMYNQPNGKSQLMVMGLPRLLGLISPSFQADFPIVDKVLNNPPGNPVTQQLPSFVIPYFGYALQGKESGDHWSSVAWQRSLLPMGIAAAILIFCLGLAYWESRASKGKIHPHDIGRTDDFPHPDGPDDLDGRDGQDGQSEIIPPLPARAARDGPEEPAQTVTTRHASGLPFKFGLPALRPAFALPGGTLQTPPGFNLSLAFSSPDNGHPPVPPRRSALTAYTPVPPATPGPASGAFVAEDRASAQEQSDPVEVGGQLPAASPLRQEAGGAEPGPSTEQPVPESEPSSVAGLVWSTRGAWLALIGVAAALYGQKLALDGDLILSTRWYALGIALVLVAWAGTCRNRSMLQLPALLPAGQAESSAAARDRRFSPESLRKLSWTGARYALAVVALGLNVQSVSTLRQANYSSAFGGWGWLASVVLLLVAFAGYKPRLSPRAAGVSDERADSVSSSPPRWAEFGIIGALFVLALALRLYRLDDWTMGVHGDEGEAGANALALLNGDMQSPFQTGWFQQFNFYYWSVAAGMKLFGTGLFGLRVFSTLAGAALVLPVYGLARRWFGLRAAIIAGTLIAISDVAIHFSRAEFSNITTPLFVATAFYLLFRGLSSGRTLDFILAAYSSMLTMYFYMGGRLTPFQMAAVFGYLFLLMPLVRLPGVYRRLRSAQASGGSALAALNRSILVQLEGVRMYAGQIVVFALACYIFAAPFLFYYLDNRFMLDMRTQEKLIFNQPQRMADQHGVTHDPLYVGLRAPGEGALLPLVFEPTGASVKLADDGFWPKALWGQLRTTLSILTYRADASSVYTFTHHPITEPVEAVLIILGIAWALWRWRDTRMAVLSIWFWSTVIVGGVLTIDAPYMARIVGIIPALALFGAVALDKLAAEVAALVVRIGNLRPVWRRAGLALTGAAVAGVLAFLTWQNAYDYYVRFVQTYPFPEVTGQAYFVNQMAREAIAKGKPPPRFHDVGVPFIFWGHGVNRFLNHDVPGDDLVNASDTMPLLDQAGQDVIFLVWPINARYLPIFKQYYPDGEEIPFRYSADPKAEPLFTAFRVTAARMDGHRVVQAAYTPAKGAEVRREETSFGSAAKQSAAGGPPEGLTYPVRATWTGAIVAPAFAKYQFRIQSPAQASLTVDGSRFLTLAAGEGNAEVELTLARGPHDVVLTGSLPSSDAAIRLTWAAGGTPYQAVDRRYIWNGVGRGLVAEVRPFVPVPFGDPPPDMPGSGGPPVLMRRVDGFLSFGRTNNTLSSGAALWADWKGSLQVETPGRYAFEVLSSNGSMLVIDGQTVVDNRQADPVTGTRGHGEVDLSRGQHNVLLRYNWGGDGAGLLELSWKPPGGEKVLVGPADLRGPVGAWPAGSVSDPPAQELPDGVLGGQSPGFTVDRTIGTPPELLVPRGIGVDAKGNVYVGDRGHHRIVVYSPDGKLLRTWGQAPSGEQGKAPAPGEFAEIAALAVAANGTVYVLDKSSPLLQVFGSDGKYKTGYDIAKLGMFKPNGLCLAPDGALYVADTGQNRVLKLPSSPDGEPAQELTGAMGKLARLNQPLDVAVLGLDSRSGPSIYVADSSDRVVLLGADGGISREWHIPMGSTDGGSHMAAGPDGTLLVADPDRGRLAVLDPESGDVRYLNLASSERGASHVPTGVAVGSDGRVYVVDSGTNNVQVLTLEK